MGFHHILEGIDHLLFLLCLIIPFRRIRPLIPIVTAFTVAHSDHPDRLGLSLRARCAVVSAADRDADRGVDFLHGAREYRRDQPDAALDHHFLLRPGAWLRLFLRPQNTLQFAGSHLLTLPAVLQYRHRIGPVAGACALRAPAQPSVRRLVAERMGVIILSAIVGHQAWHWMIERLGVLQQFPWPTFTLGDAVSGLRWAFAVVALAALLWLVSLAAHRWVPDELPSCEA